MIIEVHNDPKNALGDGAQSLTPNEYAELFLEGKTIKEEVDS